MEAMLKQSWASVVDTGPTLIQQCICWDIVFLWDMPIMSLII